MVKFCSTCGAQAGEETSLFCALCGAQLAAADNPDYNPYAGTSNLAPAQKQDNKGEG
jgi:uncharacterized membrane protein YvbJ